MSLASERRTVQNPFLRYAEEAGWIYLPPEEALRLRGGEDSPFLRSVLIDQLQRLNPGVVTSATKAEEVVERLRRVRPKQQPQLPDQQPLRRHHRRSNRLNGYDYTQAGAYFVTIVTQDRTCLFGEVVNGEMRLNAYGRIAREEWFRTAELRPYVLLFDDEFVVMPNHVHGIIWIVDDGVNDADGDTDDVGDVGNVGNVGAQRRCAPTLTSTTPSTSPFSTRPSDGPAHPTIRDINVAPGSLGAIVRAFKSAVTKRINDVRSTPGASIWQRNYYEHIIRNEESLNRIRQYIADNPFRWELDWENPSAQHPEPETPWLI